MIFNLKRSVFGGASWHFDGAEQPAWASQGSDWMMAIGVSGTLTLFAPILHGDLCLVAGGKPGHYGVSGSSPDGVGGAGGQVLSLTDVSLPAGVYTVTVGVSDSDTTLIGPNGLTWTAVSGQGKAGGRPGGDGEYAWSDPDTLLNTGWRYGAGGGHGASHNAAEARVASGAGGSVGTASSDQYAGHGGGIGTNAETHQQGWPGVDGTGQGGGGGRHWYNNGYQGVAGGSGGSGIVLIRKHKEVA